MTDDLATVMAHLRELGRTFGGGRSVDVDAALTVCDACEQQAQEIETLTDRLRTYGCQQHQHGPAVYCPTCGIPLAHASNIVPLTHAQQAQEIERLCAKEELCGTWPKGSRRAFVKGAAWWAWHHGGATMFSSERDEAEAEAEKRFTETDA